MADTRMIGNLFLGRLPATSRKTIDPRLSHRTLEAGAVLRSAGEPISEIHFVDHGLFSLVSGDRSNGVETGLLGAEGLIGASALLGAQTAASSAVARLPGATWVMDRSDFDRLVSADPEFRRHLEGYIHERLLAAAHSVVVAARCTIEQRLAGWLLLAQDCLRAEEVRLTHECLAGTLGVRRPGVTVALHMLEGKQAVRSLRGRIVIRSRERLLAAAGCAYMISSPPRPQAVAA